MLSSVLRNPDAPAAARALHPALVRALGVVMCLPTLMVPVLVVAGALPAVPAVASAAGLIAAWAGFGRLVTARAGAVLEPLDMELGLHSAFSLAASKHFDALEGPVYRLRRLNDELFALSRRTRAAEPQARRTSARAIWAAAQELRQAAELLRTCAYGDKTLTDARREELLDLLDTHLAAATQTTQLLTRTAELLEAAQHLPVRLDQLRRDQAAAHTVARQELAELAADMEVRAQVRDSLPSPTVLSAAEELAAYGD